MQVVILCGGKGTRMHQISESLPKPMILIGNKPILWHIMNLYSKNGHKDFLLLAGYKKKEIEKFFSKSENSERGWLVNILDTGIDSSKGQRLVIAKDWIHDDPFLLAYGDDLCNVDINKVIRFHKKNKKMVTLTSVRLKSNFGILDMDDKGAIKKFKEKPFLDHWISAGYIVMDKKVIDYIQTGLDETDAFELLAKKGKVQAFRHRGFWKTMNTIKDMQELNDMWDSGELQKELRGKKWK